MKNFKFFVLAVFLFSTLSVYSQGFTNINAGLTGTHWGDVAWGDYDGDGDLDVVLTGSDLGDVQVTEVYRNDGNEIFVKLTDLPIPGTNIGDIIWIDFDNDLDLDILISGYTIDSQITKIYENTGGDIFVDSGIELPAYSDGTLLAFDYNNDGYTDILISGYDGDASYLTQIYENTGSSEFLLTTIELPGLLKSTSECADYDNDGDMDLILGGLDVMNGSTIATLYENNGDGTFVQTSDSLTGIWLGDIAWGDYNSDGYIDILISGYNISGSRVATVYKNNGDKTFTELPTSELIAVSHSSSMWGDYDNDGDLDIFIAGTYEGSGVWARVTDVFINNGDDTFSEEGLEFTYDAFWGESAFADFDNDGSLDIILGGDDDFSGRNNNIYRNECVVTNNAPIAPTNLSAEVSSDQVTLSWDEASDNETPVNGLTYNLYIHRENGDVIFNSNSIVESGIRLIPAFGNTGSNTEWSILGLGNGNYTAAVQSIDNSFLGSVFSDEIIFTITESDIEGNYELGITNFELKQNYPNPFNPVTRINYELRITDYELAEIVVHNSLGQQIWSSPITDHGSLVTGSILFDGSKVNSGIYYYSLLVDGKKMDTKSMVLIK